MSKIFPGALLRVVDVNFFSCSCSHVRECFEQSNKCIVGPKEKITQINFKPEDYVLVLESSQKRGRKAVEALVLTADFGIVLISIRREIIEKFEGE